MKLVFYLCITVVLSSCCSNKLSLEDKKKWELEIYGEEPFLKNQVPTVKVNLIEFYDYDGYIFPKEYEPFWGERFTPTLIDIKTAESKLIKQNDSLGIKLKLKNRYRQYIGRYSEKGKKIIHINFVSIKKVCKTESENFFLLDKYFFQISHNPAYKEIISDQVVID